jgi:hypothetical protein
LYLEVVAETNSLCVVAEGQLVYAIKDEDTWVKLPAGDASVEAEAADLSHDSDDGGGVDNIRRSSRFKRAKTG